MEKRIAQFLSVAFHPLLIPTYALLIIFRANAYFVFIMPFTAKLLLLIMMVVSTVLVPLLLFVVFRHRGIIANFRMETKEERVYPYLSMTIIYFLAYLLFSKLQIPVVYSFFLLISTLLSLIIFFINLRWKISVHAAAIGGLTALLVGLYFKFELNFQIIIISLILCSGLVGFARLKLNSHKPSEVYAGFLVGVFVFFAMTMIL